MTDEQLIADLHGRWVFGWERDEGDPPFDFRRVFGDFYDFDSPDVRLYDDFDPEQRVAATAAEYGSIWEPVRRRRPGRGGVHPDLRGTDHPARRHHGHPDHDLTGLAPYAGRLAGRP
ncbi:hypothetical protein [Streptomyces pseudogriseolus]|uniref:hypothetical protein n=1 Tax=Streptomyces pseudogriseolus TaxID=36817 RepID=UPI003FA220AE